MSNPKYYNDAVRYGSILVRLIQYLTQKAPMNKELYTQQCYVTRNPDGAEVYGTEFTTNKISLGIVVFDDPIYCDERNNMHVPCTPLFEKDNTLFNIHTTMRRGYKYSSASDDHNVLLLREYTEEMLFQLSLIHDERYLFNEILTAYLHDSILKYSFVHRMASLVAVMKVIPEFDEDDHRFVQEIYQYCQDGEE